MQILQKIEHFAVKQQAAAVTPEVELQAEGKAKLREFPIYGRGFPETAPR